LTRALASLGRIAPGWKKGFLWGRRSRNPVRSERATSPAQEDPLGGDHRPDLDLGVCQIGLVASPPEDRADHPLHLVACQGSLAEPLRPDPVGSIGKVELCGGPGDAHRRRLGLGRHLDDPVDHRHPRAEAVEGEVEVLCFDDEMAFALGDDPIPRRGDREQR